MPDIPHQGDPVPPLSWFQSLRDEIRRRLRLRVLPPLTLQRSAAGQIIGMADVKPIHAQLSGSGSPYSWAEGSGIGATFVPTVTGRVGTSNAYELNAKTGLDGSVVDLWPGSAGTDWDFQAVPRCAPPCKIKVLVLACCGLPQSGVSVVLKDNGGTTVDTQTTGSDGTCVLSYPGNGTYSVTATITGCGTQTKTFTANPCWGAEQFLVLCDYPRRDLTLSLTFTVQPAYTQFLAGSPCSASSNLTTTLFYKGLFDCDLPNGVVLSVPIWESAAPLGGWYPFPGNIPGAGPFPVCTWLCWAELGCGCNVGLTVKGTQSLTGYSAECTASPLPTSPITPASTAGIGVVCTSFSPFLATVNFSNAAVVVTGTLS